MSIKNFDVTISSGKAEAIVLVEAPSTASAICAALDYAAFNFHNMSWEGDPTPGKLTFSSITIAD
jgi:hypothetical protein